MADKLRLYRTFTDSLQAYGYSQLLSEQGIRTKVIEVASPLGSSFGDSGKQYEIQIPNSDFERADKVFDDLANETIKNIEPDHYLYQFSNEELLEIQNNPDEWSEIDQKMSLKILKTRITEQKDIPSNLEADSKHESQILATPKPEAASAFNTFLNKHLTSIILILIGAYFVFFIPTYEPNTTDNTRTIEGVLKELPKEGEGDAIGRYIRITLLNHNDRFQFAGCSYSRRIRESVLKLKKGDSITIIHKPNSSSTTYPWSGSKYESFRICSASIKGETILNIDDFNSCSEGENTTTYPYLGIFFIVFGIGLSIKNVWFDF